MFNNLGWLEMAALAVLALFIFGPERLPKVAADAGRLVRQLRGMAQGVTKDLKAELGPEMADLDLRSLNPKSFMASMLEEPAEKPTRRPATLPPEASPPVDPDAT